MPVSRNFPIKSAVFFLLLSFSLLEANAAPKVIAIQPAAQTMVSPDNLEIVVQFDVAIDPASIDARSLSVFGRWTGVCPGEYIFEEENRQIRFKPAKTFSAGEWITVSLSKRIKSASGENMTKGYAWSFWTRTKPGSLALQEIRRISVRRPGEPRIRTYGAYAGDLNGDGFHDITLPNEESDDIRVFLNNGAGDYGSFADFDLPANSTPSTNEGADFNGDGFLDFAVGNISGGTVSVFLGDGNGDLTSLQSYPVGAGTRGLGVIDLNGDGAPDIVTAGRVANTIALSINQGNGTFLASVPMETGVSGETSCAVADANGDGLMDVFIGGFNSREIALLLGDGDGNLNFSTKVNCQGVAWMIAAGDVDNDGNVDVVSANATQNQVAVLRGDGDGKLSLVQTFNTGSFPLSIDLGDLDGDGDLDLATGNFSSADFMIFENNGNGVFGNPRRLRAQSAGSCAVLHDRDRDGDLDVTGIDEQDDLIFLFDNPGAGTVVHHAATNSLAPAGFELEQSYPNPISASRVTRTALQSRVTIPFYLKQASEVTLDIINLKGETIMVLVEGKLAAGEHQAVLNIAHLPAGTYFYRLSVGKLRMVKKMLNLRVW